MAASYPGSVKTFTTKNAGDTISQTHVNDVQDEIAAIEGGLLNGLGHHTKPTTNDTYDLGTSSYRWRALYLSGALNSTYVGAHSLIGGGTGSIDLTVRNTTAGTTNSASVFVGEDSSASLGAFAAYSSSYTVAGVWQAQSGVAVRASGTGGLALAATHASGSLRFYSGGTYRGAFLSGGNLELDTHIIPKTTNTNDLGSGTYKFKDLYLEGTATVGNCSATNALAGASVTCSAQPKAIVYKDAAQEITTHATTFYAVTWNQETVDTGGCHDNVTNNTRLTVPGSMGGVYLIHGIVTWEADAGAAGTRSIKIMKNGTTNLAFADQKPPSTAAFTMQVTSPPVALAAADYLELHVRQDSGGGLDVVQGAEYSQFSMVRLH